MTRPDGHRIDLRFREALDHWIAEACPPGGFLEAVLCNDLKEAMARGDESAIDNLPHIVSYLYNDCPYQCWGSRANVKAWRGLSKATAPYCPRCNGHHEREGDAEEKCQAETQFARADHRRRGGTI